MRISSKTTLLVLAATLLLAAAAAFLPGCSSPKTAEGVLQKSVKALGGMEKATGWKTSVSRGLLKSSMPGWGDLQANATNYIQKPDRMVIDQDYSAFDHPFFFKYTYNAGDAWVVVNLGVRQNQRYNEMLADGLRRADGIAYFLENSDTLYIEPVAGPDTILTGVDFTRIAAVEGGDTIFFDIDTKTWLPVRAVEKDAQGQINETVYSDFRPVKGLLVPFNETIYSNGAKSRETIWQTIEYDVDIDPAVFEQDKPKTSG